MCIFLYKLIVDQKISCSALSLGRSTKTATPAKSLPPPRQLHTEQPQVPASSLSNKKTGRATTTALSCKSAMSQTPSIAISAPPPSYASQKSWSSRLSFRRKSKSNGAPSGPTTAPSITPSESRSHDPYAPTTRSRFRVFCEELFWFFPRKKARKGSVGQYPPIDVVSCDPHRVYRTKFGTSRKEHDYRVVCPCPLATVAPVSSSFHHGDHTVLTDNEGQRTDGGH